MRQALVVFVATLALALSARGASAQGFLNPYIDATFDTPSLHGDGTKPGFGVAFGAAGKIVGFETDLSYYPELIDKSANSLTESSVFTFSGSLLVGPRIGNISSAAARLTLDSFDFWRANIGLLVTF